MMNLPGKEDVTRSNARTKGGVLLIVYFLLRPAKVHYQQKSNKTKI